jgi:hypothetical protein
MFGESKGLVTNTTKGTKVEQRSAPELKFRAHLPKERTLVSGAEVFSSDKIQSS